MRGLAAVATIVVLLLVSVYLVLAVVAAVAAWGLFLAGRALWRRHVHGVEDRARSRAELLARAAIQDQWYLAGDPRGTYGRFAPREVA